MSGWFVPWIVLTQAVNIAFYLALTRAVRGWGRTIGVYLVGYLVPLACSLFGTNGLLHGESQGGAGWLAVGFVIFYCLWGVLATVMSKGSLGRRLFAVLVCGVHQVGAFAFSLLVMHNVPSVALGSALGCLIMGVMGGIFLLRILPLVMKMSDRTGWRDLNLTAVMNFLLLYVSGIWPMYVPTGDWSDVMRFIVANAVAVVYFPVALVFADRNRAAAELAHVENSMRQMEAEMRARRAVIDEARREDHDRRHHLRTIAEFLSTGNPEKALTYVQGLQDEASPKLKITIWIENETVNAIFAGGERLARAEGVAFVAEADVPRQISVSDIDLVAILANLIENAIHAAPRGTSVAVRLAYENDILRFRVSNAVKGGFELKDGLPCAEPDIGILSVRTIIEKHHGFFGYQLKDGRIAACGSVSCV